MILWVMPIWDLPYLQAGRYAEAEKQLDHALKLDPANTEGAALALVYSLTGRTNEARTPWNSCAATPREMCACCMPSPSSMRRSRTPHRCANMGAAARCLAWWRRRTWR